MPTVRASCLCLVLAAPLGAQSLMALHESPVTEGSYFGENVRFVGDTDGDGIEDFGISADNDNRMLVYSGANGALRLAVQDPGALIYFGHAFDGADFDGDGLSDLAIGSWLGSKLVLVSGKTGATLHTIVGPGRAVAVVGDVNGDGVADIAGGQTVSEPATPYDKTVWVFSGAGGPPLIQAPSGSANQIGSGVTGPGDLNGDGVPDYVWCQYAGTGKSISARSGVDGSELWTASGADVALFGPEMAAVGDVNLDGVPDVAVSSQDSIPYEAVIRMQSGADGSLLWYLPHDTPPGVGIGLPGVAGPGDTDGDGRPDLLVSWQDEDSQTLQLFDGQGVGPLWSFTPPAPLPDDFTTVIVDAGPDVNGDGAPDALVSRASASGAKDGWVCLVSMTTLPWTWLGQPLAGEAGKPLLRGEGSLLAGASTSLELVAARPLAPAVLVIGTTNLSAPLKGGVLVPHPDLVFGLVTDGGGTIALAAAWPAGVPAGAELFFQVWVSDPAGPHGWAASNALGALVP